MEIELSKLRRLTLAKYTYEEEVEHSTSSTAEKAPAAENLALRAVTEPTKTATPTTTQAEENASLLETFAKVVGIGGAIALCLILLKELGLGYALGEVCEALHWDAAARALKTSGSIFRRKQKDGVLLRGQLPQVKIRDFTWLYDVIALNPYLAVDDRKVCKVTDYDLVDRNFTIRLDDLPEKRLYLYDYELSAGDLVFTFCDEEADDFYEITLPDQKNLADEELAKK
jgi:hypothetical protein